ncbi:MAG: hypothetical protein SGJ27_05920 [Candidatus Melainabacteria bacterium]|nr:hypothetical protein [Candidatus Melainabacteria bacterium]
MKKHRRLVILLTIFGLLMLVSSMYFKQPASSGDADLQTVGQHKFFFASTSIPTYLVEVKHKITNTGASGVALTIEAKGFCPRKSVESFVSQSIASECAPSPLWLLNRSILI